MFLWPIIGRVRRCSAAHVLVLCPVSGNKFRPLDPHHLTLYNEYCNFLPVLNNGSGTCIMWCVCVCVCVRVCVCVCVWSVCVCVVCVCVVCVYVLRNVSLHVV